MSQNYNDESTKTKILDRQWNISCHNFTLTICEVDKTVVDKKQYVIVKTGKT